MAGRAKSANLRSCKQKAGGLETVDADYEGMCAECSLEEQWQIAGILGVLDEKIELNRRVNANLEAHAFFRS